MAPIRRDAYADRRHPHPSPLEPEHIERIAAVDQRVEVLYRPTCCRSPRYAADHTGVPRDLTQEQLHAWPARQGRG